MGPRARVHITGPFLKEIRIQEGISVQDQLLEITDMLRFSVDKEAPAVIVKDCLENGTVVLRLVAAELPYNSFHFAEVGDEFRVRLILKRGGLSLSECVEEVEDTDPDHILDYISTFFKEVTGKESDGYRSIEAIVTIEPIGLEQSKKYPVKQQTFKIYPASWWGVVHAEYLTDQFKEFINDGGNLDN